MSSAAAAAGVRVAGTYDLLSRTHEAIVDVVLLEQRRKRCCAAFAAANHLEREAVGLISAQAPVGRGAIVTHGGNGPAQSVWQLHLWREVR